MKRIIFASKNEGKVKEVRKILSGLNLQILSLNDIDYTVEIEETGSTFEENAKIKAEEIYKIYKMPVIADDSGLSVEQLNGEPGVYSARYAGGSATDDENNLKLLKNLEEFLQPHRAKFVCAAVYCFGTDFFTAIGEVYGEIIKAPRGTNGFGYDPLFVPSGHNQTMAELDSQIKNRISHRFKAFDQLKICISE
ncbi:MAG: RdgB/HAM1 family non-canonical purine NTP pyrophosphatase [Ignavibacteria bacterium]|nr:RdgB/HAM1 family non-canonical purine NTP pyrophosphatase [Ignavibacteria bacterium]MBT8383923.1 RdgB/HAM1 family non-canonical purine NTP pyrophosphatase [Ignavibacteria bacterium]MBT8391476.1 RdgB/HAM1 family non-canonical purine NTP pyrophosphatase [Ignavibacteria bacterium]NNJ54139.1 RdgB/HAM1 family non-canonical purine NTP pyrophosphatase [Ignavibacteriaceae bacterium]NNL21406.1 RdgB/HAM1 family non-canonical purine NTP pyrophosphatase [Ignavibacteriaceae bacterium]